MCFPDDLSVFTLRSLLSAKHGEELLTRELCFEVLASLTVIFALTFLLASDFVCGQY